MAEPHPGDPVPLGTHLLRRISPKWMIPRDVVWSDRRLSSQAFQDLTLEGATAMSVHVEEDLVAKGLEPLAVVDDLPGYGVVRLETAKVVGTGIDLQVLRAPHDRDRTGFAHAHVIGKKTGGRKKRLVALGEKNWLRRPSEAAAD